MGVRIRGGNLAAHSVGVAALAAGPCGPVMGALTQSKAQPGGRVATETRQAERQQRHCAPSGAGVGRGAGARSVCTVVLIVLSRTVIE